MVSFEAHVERLDFADLFEARVDLLRDFGELGLEEIAIVVVKVLGETSAQPNVVRHVTQQVSECFVDVDDQPGFGQYRYAQVFALLDLKMNKIRRNIRENAVRSYLNDVSQSTLSITEYILNLTRL